VVADDAVPAVTTIKVLVVALVTVNVVLSCGAVIPPTATAPLKVTESPSDALWFAIVTRTLLSVPPVVLVVKQLSVAVEQKLLLVLYL